MHAHVFPVCIYMCIYIYIYACTRFSYTGVYKICCLGCNKLYIYIRETSRNLNKRIYEHKKDF